MLRSHYLVRARAQAGVIHRRQLRADGIDDRALRVRLRIGDLVEVAPDVYRASGAPTGWQQALWIAVLDGGPGTTVSHRSAAHLHSIGPFGADAVDVVQAGNPNHPIRPGEGHRSLHLPAHHVTSVARLPVTTVERTVFDLASLASHKRRRRGWPYATEGAVERALDDALATGHRHGAFTSLLDTHGGRGRGGTVLMRTLLEQRGDGFATTESPLEDLVLRVLADAGLPLPEKQADLGSHDAWVGRVDFNYPLWKVVIEADGRRHHTALLDRERDQWRDLELASAGFTVIHVTWKQLREAPSRFVRSLRALLLTCGWSPTP